MAGMCGAGRTLAHPVASPDGSLIGFVALGGGRPRVVTVPSAGGDENVVTSDPPAAGCHAHGGGVFDWFPDSRSIAYVGTDGSLYRAPVAGGRRRLLFAGGDVESPAVSPDGSRVVFVVNGRSVVVTSTDGDGGGSRRTVSSSSPAPDFVLDPVWHPDGRRVAWLEWDVPSMPWDSSRVAVADVDVRSRPDIVAGGDGTSVGQPRWSPDGFQLAFVCDATGWPVVWVADQEGAGARPCLDTEGWEHAEPTWGPGQRSFAFSPDSHRIALSRNRGGFWCLAVAAVAGAEAAARGEPEEPEVQWPGLHAGLGWFTPPGRRSGRPSSALVARRGADGIVVFHPESPPQRIPERRRAPESPPGPRVHAAGLAPDVVARGPLPDIEEAVERWRRGGVIEPVSWPASDGSGAEIHGRLFRSAASAQDPAPLIVWIHGGPTGQMPGEVTARLVYFLERGWAVLAPDFRGSSGWGRSYLQALRGGWGATDVGDVAAGMRAAGDEGWGDPRRLVVMGASAGGLCVLLLLAHHRELCAAGVDLYGVTDLADLRTRTHRFEAHYTETLVGPVETSAALLDERSPLAWADRIAGPLLVLHGARDPVVPVEQSAALVDAVRRAGGEVEFHVYEDEKHGWSEPGVVADEIERIDAFLTRHVTGVGPAGIR